MDYRTKGGTEAFVSLMLAAVKYNIEQAGGLEPIAILITGDPEGQEIVIPAVSISEDDSKEEWVDTIMSIGERDTKDVWLEKIQQGVKVHNPIGVFVAAEAWKVTVETAAEADALIEATGGHLSTHEKREEVVDVFFEHREFGKHSWEANIIRGESNKLRITPFRLRPKGQSEGRFSNFLR